MPFLTLNYDQAHDFVEDQQNLGNDVRWDGWDIVFFKPSAKAVTAKEGVCRNGQWGFEKYVSVNSNGVWSIPSNYERKSFRRTRVRSERT